jgi:hypothetical protein
MFEDSFIPRALKAFHAGPVNAAVVPKNISGSF